MIQDFKYHILQIKRNDYATVKTIDMMVQLVHIKLQTLQKKRRQKKKETIPILFQIIVQKWKLLFINN